MLPQIVPAGVDGLSLCGSKAAFVQGGSARPLSFLPSSKPHVVRAADPAGRVGRGTSAGAPADPAAGGWAGAPALAASGSAWGVKVKRVKEALQDGREARPRGGARAHARGGTGSSGSTAAAVLDKDQGLAAALGGEALHGWGEDDSDALLQAVGSNAGSQPDGERFAAGQGAWQPAAHSAGHAHASAQRPVQVDSVDDKENDPGRATGQGPDRGKDKSLQQAPAQQAPAQPAGSAHRPRPLGGAHRDGGEVNRREGAGERGGGAGAKDELAPRGKPRLGAGARGRIPSCPEPQDASRRVVRVASSSDTSHTAKNAGPAPAAATRRGVGTGPPLAGSLGKGRLASTLPTLSSQRPGSDDDRAHMQGLLSVAHVVQAAAAPVARRARSADDPPCPGAGGFGIDGADAGGGDPVGRDVVKQVRERAPVDLAALQQKAKERIVAKKKKERQQMEEWEAAQERAKRERQEAKEGADAEMAQKRAAIYALNYLMHQQEWGAWLEFEREQQEGKSRPSSCTSRSRPSSKAKRTASSSKRAPVPVGELAAADPVGVG